MKSTARCLGLAGLFVLLLSVAAAPVLAAQCASQTAEGPKKPRLESNEFFEVKSPIEIVFRSGIKFEAVKTSEGKSLLRFNFEEMEMVGADPVPAPIECRCAFPTVCTRNTCKVTTTGGKATCEGGCYKPDGGACVSCEFFTVVANP